MHLDVRRCKALDTAQPARRLAVALTLLSRRPQDARARGRGLRIGPVVRVLVAAAAPRRESTDVRPVRVCTLKLLVGEVAVLVPVLFLGDAEVDEGLVPDVGEAHLASDVTQRAGKSLLGRCIVRAD